MASLTALEAAARAYALVSFADGRLTPAEECGFRDFAAADPAFEGAPAEARAAAWSDAMRAVLASGEHCRDVLEEITAASLPRAEEDAVLRAAQRAIVSDLDVKPQEEAWVAEIARALGRDPHAA